MNPAFGAAVAGAFLTMLAIAVCFDFTRRNEPRAVIAMLVVANLLLGGILGVLLFQAMR